MGYESKYFIVEKNSLAPDLADETDSYLQTTGGEWYVYTCEAGEFMIAFFAGKVERDNNIVVYAVSKTGK